MRLTSDFFVSALIRHVFKAGGYAVVEKKGASEAGAIFLRLRARDGLETLYAPAPQSFFDEDTSGDRRFEIRSVKVESEEVEEILAREKKFDQDLWVIEIEIDDISNLNSIIGPGST